MKATRINRIKDKSQLNVPVDNDNYVIHCNKDAIKITSSVITSTIIFSFLITILFIAILMVGFFIPALEDYIFWIIAIDCILLAASIVLFAINASKKTIEATSTFATDKYSDILYKIQIRIKRDSGFTRSGTYYSIPDFDSAINDSKKYDRIITDIELTKKNINVIDFWYGGDKVFEYSFLSLQKETDKYLYVTAYLTNKSGTTYDRPKKKKLKISKKVNDLDAIRNICDKTIINV